MNHIIVFILGGIWRRINCGWLKHIHIIKERGTHTLFCIYMYNVILTDYVNSCLFIEVEYKQLISITLSTWIAYLFWSKGHSVLFSKERDFKREPTKDEISLYNELWCINTVKKLFRKDNHYNREFDFVLMIIRYTIPIIPFIIIHYYVIFSGLMIATIYYICSLITNEKYCNDDFISCKYDIAEFLTGGLLCVILL